MHLVQILLPLYDNDGTPFARDDYEEVRHELADRFGGITAYVRAPAEGMWKEGEGPPVHDEIVIYEIMVDALDRQWWHLLREELARRFRQETLVVRALAMETL